MPMLVGSNLAELFPRKRLAVVQGLAAEFGINLNKLIPTKNACVSSVPEKKKTWLHNLIIDAIFHTPCHLKSTNFLFGLLHCL